MEDRVKESVQRIAVHLDWELTDGPRDNALYLVGPEDVRVLVSQAWNERGKLNFSVSLDDGLHNFEPYNPDRPKATVSMDRDSLAAAKDVKRRCLDPAIPYIRKLREKKAIKDTEKAEQWAMLEDLAQALGGQINKGPNHDDVPRNAKVQRGNFPTYTIRISLSYDKGLIDVEMDKLPMGIALDLCAWLRFRLWPENGQQGRLL